MWREESGLLVSKFWNQEVWRRVASSGTRKCGGGLHDQLEKTSSTPSPLPLLLSFFSSFIQTFTKIFILRINFLHGLYRHLQRFSFCGSIVFLYLYRDIYTDSHCVDQLSSWLVGTLTKIFVCGSIVFLVFGDLDKDFLYVYQLSSWFVGTLTKIFFCGSIVFLVCRNLDKDFLLWINCLPGLQEP